MNEPISRRAALEAAFDEHMTEDADGVVTEKETPPEGAAPYEREAVAAKKSEETPAGQEAQEGEGGTPPQQKPAEATKGATKEGQQTQAPAPEGQQGDGPPIKAPVSWRGPEKAHWDKIPRAAQEAIARRELETQQVLSRSGQARQFVQEFGKTIMPYSHLIRAQGSTPLAAVDNLMRTAANLMTGDPQRKAQVVAEIISGYGVDLEVLDQVLVAQQKNGGPRVPDASIPPQLAAALKPVYDFMGTVQQQREQYEQQRSQQAEQSVEQFGADKPYFEELRSDMGDLMEMAANRGRNMTLEQAYKIALAAHPEYQVAPPGTHSQQDLSRAAATLARARRAGSSVKGGPASGGGALPPPKSRREALERAWDEQTER